MGQYSGFGNPEATNERFKFLLAKGQTALALALDLPTQLGLESDHELADAEWGRRCGRQFSKRHGRYI